MGAKIQWLSEKDGEIGVFRCGHGFNVFGDPYEMVSTIQKLPDGGVHMFGVQSTLGYQLFQNLPVIRELMRKEGFVSYIIWEKLRPDGTMKKVRIKCQ